jgi:hypothetical protein
LTPLSVKNPRRLEGDIAILTKYLKTDKTPKAVITSQEGLRTAQEKAWDATVDKIKELLEG